MAVAPPDVDRDLDADVVTRLADADLPQEVEDLILAALDSDEALADALGGSHRDRPELQAAGAEDTAAAEPVGAYVSRVRVAAFRGIGPEAELRLRPGPGLTVVTGRNGSGKSSFAEAAEIALTGDTKRWAGRTQVWRQGWRNLHAANIPTRVDVDLVIDGRLGTTTIGRHWPADGDLGDAQPGSVTCGDLGWTDAVETYRPFLSYAELGAVVDGKPSEMYDAVQRVLGLDRLVDAQARLNAALKERRDIARRATAARAGVRALVEGHPDPRAAEASRILAPSTPDLKTLDRLIQGLGDISDGGGRASEVLSLAVPDAATVAAAVEAWTMAAVRVGGLAGTSAERARSLATLLGQALACTPEDANECPVCRGDLPSAWHAHTRLLVEQLTHDAKAADEAHTELATARRALAELVPPPPRVLTSAAGATAGDSPYELSAIADAWSRARTACGAVDSPESATAAASAVADLRDAVDFARAQAREELDTRAAAWAPVAEALAVWSRDAKESREADAAAKLLTKAKDWLKDAADAIRNDRLQPLSAQSQEIWAELRHESNVELGPVTLTGSSTQRRVTLDVTVDGVGGAALSVMSQGELHALGLALFLPRATVPASPFGFLVIDDPVQSMDPAKVDGLARVLNRVAATRQVVVFTHDDRLPEAVRRLRLPATVLEVRRRKESAVSVTVADDPVSRYLADARAMALSEHVSDEAKRLVVATLCRLAIEAAAHDRIRADRLARGERHADVEQLVAQPRKLHEITTLAVFGDPTRANDLYGRLTTMGGHGTVAAFKAIKEGAHRVHAGDLTPLIKQAELIAAKVGP
jgi:recombinational DNA repair ATPase RecF